jgi:hypothetical protein
MALQQLVVDEGPQQCTDNDRMFFTSGESDATSHNLATIT